MGRDARNFLRADATFCSGEIVFIFCSGLGLVIYIGLFILKYIILKRANVPCKCHYKYFGVREIRKFE